MTESDPTPIRDRLPAAVPRPPLLTVSVIVAGLASLGMAFLGLTLTMGIRVVRENRDIDVEELLDPAHGVAIWAREPIRALWENGLALGTGLMIYAAVMCLVLVQAWLMRRWALILVFPLSAGLLVTGVLAPIAVLMMVAAGTAYARSLSYSREFPALLLQHPRPPVSRPAHPEESNPAGREAPPK